MSKIKKDTCLRCGADKKEWKRLGGGGCAVYGTYYGRHLWGNHKGKTVAWKPNADISLSWSCSSSPSMEQEDYDFLRKEGSYSDNA